MQTEDQKMLRIRFNTENNGNLKWRVIIEGEEHLAEHVTCNVPTFDTTDELPGGKIKHHFSCYYTQLEWIGKVLIVR